MKICRINFPLDKFLKVWYKYAHCKSELQKVLFKNLTQQSTKEKKYLTNFKKFGITLKL